MIGREYDVSVFCDYIYFENLFQSIIWVEKTKINDDNRKLVDVGMQRVKMSN